MSTKNTLALATLVAAVPAAVLGFLLVGTFLQQLDPLRHRGTMYVALYGTTLAACAGVVFLPIAVLIFGPRSPKVAKRGAAGSKSGTIAAAPPTSVDQPVVTDSLVEDEDDLTEGKAMSTGELEVVEATPSMEEIAAYDDEAIPPSTEMPVIEEEDFLFDEEPQKPKKKGK